MTAIRRLFLWSYLLLTTTALRAQVFIPDTLVRAWLNQSIPGIVDANGIMDTTHAGIAGCDSVLWSGTDLNSDTLVIDLQGIQYLDSLNVLFITYHVLAPDKTTFFHLPVMPISIKKVNLHCGEGIASVNLPSIDHSLQYLGIGGGPTGRIDVNIGSISDSIENLSINSFRSISCDSFTGYINSMSIGLSSNLIDTTNISLPGWECGLLYINGNMHNISIDLDGSIVNALATTYGRYGHLSWPLELTQLSISGYASSPLPALPPTLLHLIIEVFDELCLPAIPNGLLTLTVQHGVNCVPDIPGSVQSLTGPFLWQIGDTVFCTVLNSDCPGSASAIAGRHAIDDNGNGLLDAGEPAFPWGRVLIQPMNALVPAGIDGWWERGAQPGTYTIEPNSTYPYLISSDPAQHTATFVALGEVDSTNHFAHILLPGVNDLQVSAYAVPPRPGFNNDLTLSYRNFGTTSLPATLQLAVDADQSFVGSSPAPTTLSGNSATWDLGTLPIGAQGQVLVTLHTDATVPLGTPVQHTAVIDPVAGDTVPSNNTTLWTDTVVGAYDPNDKLLDIPAATPAEVQADAVTLTYTIRFQNTGTHPAERVVILDTLSDDLQWNSFEFLSSSHPCQWYMLDGVLHFIFDPILLPDSGSNEPASHGFVRFRMRPSTQLIHGDQVDNIAHIVFDFNTPIVTPPATFRVDMSTGLQEQAVSTLTVMPNPTRDRLLIGGFADTAVLRVLDLSGRLLHSTRATAPARLDVADLRPGTYLLEVRTPQRSQAVRFVKE